MIARRRTSHHLNPKQQLVGVHGPTVAPAWRAQAAAMQHRSRADSAPNRGVHHEHEREPTRAPGFRKLSPEVGSKILISYLPADVTAADLWDLFKVMVGPLKDVVLAYDPSGVSMGVAVVHFHRVEDGIKARNMYNGKIIDGSNPIRIELVIEPKPTMESTNLLSRLRPAPQNVPIEELPIATAAGPKSMKSRIAQPGPPAHAPPAPRPKPAAPPQARIKKKKGPKRVKKTLQQLDQEMDEYRASAQE